MSASRRNDDAQLRGERLIHWQADVRIMKVQAETLDRCLEASLTTEAVDGEDLKEMRRFVLKLALRLRQKANNLYDGLRKEK